MGKRMIMGGRYVRTLPTLRTTPRAPYAIDVADLIVNVGVVGAFSDRATRREHFAIVPCPKWLEAHILRSRL